MNYERSDNLSVFFSLLFNSMFSFSELIDLGAIKLELYLLTLKFFDENLCIYAFFFVTSQRNIKKSYGRG